MLKNQKQEAYAQYFARHPSLRTTFLRVGYVSQIPGCPAASFHPPFSPTLTRAAPTPLPGISGSFHRSGDAHRMVVLMLRFAESAHWVLKMF